MAKHATIHDVAKLSNVSVASVSRALCGGNYPVSDATRKRVLDAARQLNYTPNAASKALKTRCTHEIGVIIPNITNPCYAQLVKGIQDAAIQRQYHVLLYNSYRNPAQEAKNIDMLLQKRVDGIWLASINPDSAPIVKAMGLDCRVITMEQDLSLPCIHVGYDYYRGGWLATRHLIEHGHRRIGFIGAPLDRPSRVQMLSAYRHCLKDAGLSERPEDIILSDSEEEGEGIYEVNNGARAAELFSQMRERPTGYVCLNDMTALGTINAFRKHGLKVPRDLSIVGFDNIPYGELAYPGLTTVDQHAGEMGAMAVRLLVEQIEQPDIVQYAVKLTPNLIQRQSVRTLSSQTKEREHEHDPA